MYGRSMLRFRNLGNIVRLISSMSFKTDSDKAVGSFCMVCMEEEVKDPTQATGKKLKS